MTYFEDARLDDLFLVLALVLIGYGLYDPSRMLLILGGVFIFIIILMGDDIGT